MLLAVSLCVGAAACQSTSGTTVDPATVKGFDQGSSAVRAPSTQRGGTLRLVIGAVDSLDPARSYSPGVWNLMRLYTRQLVTYAPRPGAGGTGLVPDLATSLGRSTDGGRTWTYTLRTGVRWEDGTPLTSADVKYGIERLFASGVITGGPTWAVGLLDVAASPYDGPYEDTSRDRLGLTTVSTPNDRTIVFRLNHAFPDWDQVMALPVSSPVRDDKDSGKLYAKQPASVGPYRTSGIGANGVAVFVRNPYWSRAIDPVRAALPDRIEVATSIVPAERDRRLLTGAADADITGSGLQPEAAAQVLASPALTARADDPTTGTVRFVAMQSAVAPLDNVHCRRALQYAVDKTAVKDAIGGTFAAALATTLWPRGLPGYPATAPYPSGTGNRGDLAAARTELARCGHPTGFTVSLAAAAGGRDGVTASAVRRALSRIGVVVTIRSFPRATFLSSVVGTPAVLQAQKIGLVVADWAADFPAPYAFLVPLVDGRSIRKVANPNVASLADAGVTAAVDRAAGVAARSRSPVQAQVAWQAVAAKAMQQASYLPLVEDRALLLGSTRLRNAYVQPAYRGYDVTALGVR